jgi:hypothetical protein
MSNRRRITARERERMIAEAAYYRALRRSSDRADALRDWVEAESEIDAAYEVAPAESRLEQLTEQLHEANEHLRRVIVAVRAEATEEWYEDINRAKRLRDALALKLDELRVQTGRAEQKLRRQAEKTWSDLAKMLKRIGTH